VSPLVEIRLVALREVSKSIRSVKGIILGVLTLLGAFATSLVCVFVEGQQRAKFNAESPEAYIALKKAFFMETTSNEALAESLSHAPFSLYVFFQVTVWLVPLLVALVGFDAISAEYQHRTIRFWTVRTRRSSYFIGKYLGLVLVVGSITLLLNVLASIVVLSRGYATVGELVTYGGEFWGISVPMTLAWAAIAVFVSSRFRTPILALLTTFGAFFVLWVAWVVGNVASASADNQGSPDVPLLGRLVYVYPNHYSNMLLSHEPKNVAAALAVLVLFSAAVSAGGSLLLAKRDV
jgi:ABC-type transport system involved in multi-copper enzyme maturation permease subunit